MNAHVQSGRDRAPLHARPGSVFTYAVVDLASAPDLSTHVMGRMSHEARPLFSPDLPIEVLAVGPWLANLAWLPDLRATVKGYDSDVPWGYYLHASIDIVSMRRALRRFNLVELSRPRRAVLFRYWDPRVMKTFLHVAEREQRELLFEFIDRIEDPGGRFDARYDGS